MTPNYSVACSIPSPKDVYNHPLVLFSNSVITSSPVILNKMDQKNYRSYIIAIAKFANERAPWSDDTISDLSKAAKNLDETLHKKGIVLHPLEEKTMELLLNPSMSNFNIFSDCYCHLRTLI